MIEVALLCTLVLTLISVLVVAASALSDNAPKWLAPIAFTILVISLTVAIHLSVTGIIT